MDNEAELSRQPREKDGERDYTIYKPRKEKFEISKLLDGISSHSEITILQDKVDMILSNQEEMKTDIKNILSDMTHLMKQNEEVIFKILDEPNINEQHLQSSFNELNSAIDNLLLEVPTLKEKFERLEAQKSIDTKADLKGKFKVKWSLLPELLTDNTMLPNIVYEKELSASLSNIVKKISTDFKEGRCFREEV